MHACPGVTAVDKQHLASVMLEQVDFRDFRRETSELIETKGTSSWDLDTDDGGWDQTRINNR